MKILIAFGLALCPLFSFAQTKQIAFSELTAGSGMFFGAEMNSTTITVTVQGPSDRFIGFGFGSSMSSGDAIIWSTLGSGAGALQLRDHTMQGHQEPAVDAQQDWTVISNNVASGSRTIVASRALNTGESNDVTFNFSNTSQMLFWARAQTASNQVAYHGSNRANGIVRNWVLADVIPPTLSSTVPADNASGVSLTANLSATFNENIAFGTGSITLYDENNVVVQTVSNGSPGLTITGPTLTFNPSANLVLNTGYYLHMDPTAITDAFGNAFAGIADNTTWNFNTNDLTAPNLVTLNPLSPADNSSGVGLTSDLTATFTENIQTGTGVIELFSGTNTLVESFDVATSPQISISNATLTINPTADLLVDVGYYVHIANGAVQDLSGNNYAGISSNTAWNFNTNSTAAPELVANPFSPADNAISVNTSANLTVTFNEPIVLASGAVRLFHINGTLAEAFTTSSPGLTVTGNTLTINPTLDLEESTQYYITIQSGLITDVPGNAYNGFTDDATWNFTTGDFTGPVLEPGALSPADNAVLVPVTSILTITFSEAIELDAGLIRLINPTNSAANQDFDVAVGTGLMVSGNQLEITPATAMVGASNYHVLIAPTAIKDLAGNPFMGITSSTTWNFTTGSGVGLDELSEIGIIWDGKTLVLPDEQTSALIMDVTGKTIRKNLSQTTDCSGLTSGIYFVGLETFKTQESGSIKIFRIFRIHVR